MALVHSLVDNTEITHPNLKAFLHQRTRQWKYTDLSFTPTQCTELPSDYHSDRSAPTVSQDAKPISWTEELNGSGPLSSITETLNRLCLDVNPSTCGEKTMSDDSNTNTDFEWKSGSVLCPTFAGGKESAAECVFTDSAVQRAILSFFETVAQDPERYRNPAFTTFADVPHPTADTPFALSADPIVPDHSDTQSALPVVTFEQADLEEARTKLADMRIALDACPEDVAALAKGRSKLYQKITDQEAAIKDLQVKALSSGGTGAGEAEELRQDWSPKVGGPQVPFAGTMVDSELLKAAGLGGTANEELEKLG